jgi:hypothetical protein
MIIYKKEIEFYIVYNIMLKVFTNILTLSRILWALFGLMEYNGMEWSGIEWSGMRWSGMK